MFRHTISLVSLLLIAAIVPAVAVTTAFTYQGKLTDSLGAPISGPRDLAFKLFDAETGGNQIGDTVECPGATVSSGLFTVSLDFGAGVFDGSARWLETTFENQALSPRAQITTVPYATYAATVADGAITSEKLADGAVTASKLAASALGDSAFGRRTLKITSHPFRDANGDTGDYLRVTNGRAEAWIDVGCYNSTWAMDTSQIGACGFATNCMTWEPYVDGTQNGSLFSRACDWGTATPNNELRKHGFNNATTLTTNVRFYKDIAGALADAGAFTDKSKYLIPNRIARSHETLVVARQRAMYPFTPYANAYPAIQFRLGGRIVAGWEATSAARDYGVGDTPEGTIHVGVGSPDNWAGGPGGERMCGIVVDWPYDAYDRNQTITLRIFVKQIVKTGGDFHVVGRLYPYMTDPESGYAFDLSVNDAELAEVEDNTWWEHELPAHMLRKGTNVFLLHTTGGSATKYIDIGADLTNIASKLHLKNFVIMNSGDQLWTQVRLQTEYWAFYRDLDKITTWSRTDSGSGLSYDFVGATLGVTKRAPGRWSGRRNATLGDDYPMDRSLKALTSPTRLECQKYGVKNLGEAGFTMSEPSANGDIGLFGIFTGLSGDERYITFSRGGKYPIKWIFGESAGDPSVISWKDPRISSYNDPYIHPSPTDAYSGVSYGWSLSWTDTPCAGGREVPAGTRTPLFTADLTGLANDILRD